MDWKGKGRVLVYDMETIQRPIPEEFKKGILDGKVRTDRQTKDPKKIWGKLKEKFWTQAEGSKPIAIGFAVIDRGEGILVKPFGKQSDDETDLSEFVMSTLAEYLPRKLLGYNSEHFDLPVLEHMLRNSGLIYAKGVGRWDHIDLIKNIPQFFGGNRALKNSPVSAAALYGIKYSGTSGGDVKELWEADKKNGTKKVLEYCLDDVNVTCQVALKASVIRNFLG